jgi:hypothetical protein
MIGRWIERNNGYIHPWPLLLVHPIEGIFAVIYLETNWNSHVAFVPLPIIHN